MGIDPHRAVNSVPPLLPREFSPALGSPGGARTKPERSETGVWIGMFAILMSFAAFTSAMIVRQGASADWRHFSLPRVLYANTLTLLVSSVSLAFAGRRLSSVEPLLASARDLARRAFADGMKWLHMTLALGGLFVFGQVLAWRSLAAQGLFLATNPSSSFFYVFTAMHGLHLLGGMAGLIYMQRKLSKTNGTARTTGMRAMSLYWHFMDGLWIFLLVLLMVRT